MGCVPDFPLIFLVHSSQFSNPPKTVSDIDRDGMNGPLSQKVPGPEVDRGSRMQEGNSPRYSAGSQWYIGHRPFQK